MRLNTGSSCPSTLCLTELQWISMSTELIATLRSIHSKLSPSRRALLWCWGPSGKIASLMATLWNDGGLFSPSSALMLGSIRENSFPHGNTPKWGGLFSPSGLALLWCWGLRVPVGSMRVFLNHEEWCSLFLPCWQIYAPQHRIWRCKYLST